MEFDLSHRELFLEDVKMKTLVLLFCFLAMLCYSLEICVTDLKLTRINARVLTLLYSGGVFLFSVAGLALFKPTAGEEGSAWPRGAEWVFVLLMAGASWVAAQCHFSALYYQSGAVMLTMFYVLLPVMASVYAAIFKGEWPTSRLVVAWVLAGVALYLVSTRPPPGGD